MAKIIDRQYIVPLEYHLVCKHCGCLAEYKEKELEYFSGMCDEELVGFSCPNCRKKTYTLRENLPIPSNVKAIRKKNAHDFFMDIKEWFKETAIARKILQTNGEVEEI